jgi:TolB protein
MKKWMGFCCLLVGLVWVIPSFAVLDLELTNGTKRAVPLGIATVTGTASESTKQEVMKTIENDLKNSGWFHLLVSQQNSASAFREKGANAFLTGEIDEMSNGQVRLDLQLVGLYSGSVGGENLMHVEYKTQIHGLRALAHQVSDQIFEKLTGVRGNFSTKLAYITVHYPKGRYVTFNLMVSDADGHNPQLLFKSYDPILSLAWSPDGKKLAYVSFAHNRAQIYMQSLVTGERQLVIAYPGINGAPTFSPDGSQMALVLTKTGSPKIYELNLQTKQLRQLTKGLSIDTEPSWSPNGQSLLFTSNRDGNNPQIYQYFFQSDAVKRLTFSGNYNARARWLPEGNGFIMMHRDGSHRGFSVALQRLGSSTITSLTPAGAIESPSVAPNGQMVVYAINSGLGQVSIDSDITLSLPGRDGMIQEPVWSPYLH